LRILTVHGSKGLEFPIAILAGFGRGRQGPASAVEVIADRRSGALHCRAGDLWRTADYPAASDHEKEMAEAEAVRLLYVAATRARDHLVLSLYRGKRAEQSHAALMEQRLERFLGSCHALAVPEHLPQRETPTAPAAMPPGPDDEADWIAQRKRRIQLLSAPAVLSEIDTEDDGADEERYPADMRAAVRLLLRRSPDLRTLPEDPAPDPVALAFAERFLASQAVQRARRSPRVWRLVPLLGTVDGVILELTADLLYQTAAGVVAVGLQFDEHPSGNGRVQEAATEDQARRLARAVLAATGQPPAAVDIVRVEDGKSLRYNGPRLLSHTPV
jgi:ATP-dependent exoDNAse (exonuclease V) beta subunit